MAGALARMAEYARGEGFDVDAAYRWKRRTRNFVRSSIFVARYFNPIAESSPQLLSEALETWDGSNLTLEDRLRDFIEFYRSRDFVASAEVTPTTRLAELFIPIFG